MRLIITFMSLLIGSVAFAQGPMPPCVAEASRAAIKTASWPVSDDFIIGDIAVIDQDADVIIWRVEVLRPNGAPVDVYDVRAGLPSCRVSEVSFAYPPPSMPKPHRDCESMPGHRMCK